jgi:hypothetical protein
MLIDHTAGLYWSSKFLSRFSSQHWTICNLGITVLHSIVYWRSAHRSHMQVTGCRLGASLLGKALPCMQHSQPLLCQMIAQLSHQAVLDTSMQYRRWARGGPAVGLAVGSRLRA